MPDEKTVLVQVSYDPDPKKVGKYVELTEVEARDKVAQGRARYATDEERAEHAKSSKSASKDDAKAATKGTPDGAPADQQPANATETTRSQARSGPSR